MDDRIAQRIGVLPDEIIGMFMELRAEVYGSVDGDNVITELLWAGLPSYRTGRGFVRIIPFRDHINVEAEAVLPHAAELDGYKLTPKGMLQIFTGQKIPTETLRLIFRETLTGMKA